MTDSGIKPRNLVGLEQIVTMIQELNVFKIRVLALG